LITISYLLALVNNWIIV